ncbi:MAG: hypothetical protein H6917_19565 [Novosphingobium sp.]|nr:hypothetical protein [Novosphingobium sp.]MCP5404578.1 hypothetical protein [Novosphingobium sp.]
MPRTIPVTLGPLGGDKLEVRRSGFRWLIRDGQACRPGDVLGFCNISFFGDIPDLPGHIYFDQEQSAVQLAVISRVSGRLYHAPNSSKGGWLDRIRLYIRWHGDQVVANLEIGDDVDAELAQAPVTVRCIAGSRVSDLAEDNGRLLGGWRDRSRVWDVSDGEPTGSVVGLGICELAPVLQGDDGIFGTLLDRVAGPAHVVNVWDAPLVHSARVIIEQINRTPEEAAALAEDFLGVIRDDPGACEAADWIFAAASVHALRRSPASDRFDMLTRTGIEAARPADAVILSVNAEPAVRLRHRRLGYVFGCHEYRIRRLGHSAMEWLKRNFEREPNPVDQTRKDYLELAAILRKSNPNVQILVLNAMSTLGREDILSYDVFDPPIGQSLRSVCTQEANAILHDLAREADFAIVDADAIGAELGGMHAIPDAVHQNGEMQEELRKEILAILDARKVPGFSLRK